MKPFWPSMSHDDKRQFVSKNLQFSSTEIAKLVSGASRNAIIGFCHRNKLQLSGGTQAEHAAKTDKRAPEKPVTQPTEPKKTRAPVSRVPKKKEPKPVELKLVKPEAPAEAVEETIEEIVEKVFGPVNIMMLTEKTCKWPLNATYVGLDVEEMMFCGHQSRHDSPWCTPHARIAYGGVFSGGKVVWRDGEGPGHTKINKVSMRLCRT